MDEFYFLEWCPEERWFHVESAKCYFKKMLKIVKRPSFPKKIVPLFMGTEIACLECINVLAYELEVCYNPEFGIWEKDINNVNKIKMENIWAEDEAKDA
jgi:hypothetical protein